MSKNVTAKPVTATSTTKVTEELLICRLCSLKYSTDGRRPMALRCVHTFCERCLEQLLRDQLDDSDPTKNQKQRRDKRQPLVCPTCETVTHLAKGCMPSSLPVNPSVMELLEIFDGLRAVEDLQQSGVRNTPVVPGYSQVKVTATKSRGQDSTANGQLSQQPDSTAVSALMKHKEDTRGLDPASRRSHGNGSVDEGGGGGARNMKLISTVNVGTSSPHLQQQQQQHQQQQSTSSFSTAKLSSAPAAMTSAVTSVSTLKMHPQQSSSTSSSTVVSSCDTNAGPTSTAPAAVAHKCCRCGLRPAAVSVASSSQTMTPKKLCSDCWNQPVAGKNGEDQKRGAASVGAEEQIVTTTADTKQPERFSVTAGKISMVKADLRSDVNASAMTQTTEAANTGPQTEKDDSAAANSSSSSAPLKRETAAAGLVANGKSTIEVRRRSGYFDNRARAAPTSTPDSSTTEAAATGTTVDQPAAVQSTTVRTANAARGSKPRQPLAIDAPQGSTIDGTSPDAQLNAVPEAISEERPTSSGSKSDTGGSTNHLGNTAEVGEHGVVRDNTSCRGSAPSIAEIHPLPCSNPPYNPDFIEDSSTAWSSIENQRRASDTPAATGRLNLTSPETRSHEQHQRKQQPQDISATAGKGLALSFLLSNSGHRYPAEQPPKYEDIIHENEAIAATARESPASRTQSSQAVLPAPIEPVAATATPAAMRLVRSFGKYGEISTQPGAFREPGRVCVSPAAEKEETSTRVIVSDKANGTVQVFGDAGECLSMLRADAVRGCCLLDNSRKLLLATSRGVEVYDINGSRQETMPVGAVLNVVPYERGFIAVQSKSLSLFKGTSFSTQARTLTSKAKPGQFNRLLQFDDICDVAVNSHEDLVVLEAANGGLITVMANDGYIKSTISPVTLDGCGRLQAPSAIAVDSAHNIVVSESGRDARVLLFGANGRLQRVLHGPASPAARVTEPPSSETAPWPAALDVGPDDRLYVIMRADKFAEIRVYEYL